MADSSGDEPVAKTPNWLSLGDLGPIVPQLQSSTWKHKSDGSLQEVENITIYYHKLAKEVLESARIKNTKYNIEYLWEGQGDPGFLVEFSFNKNIGNIACSYRQIKHLHDRRFEIWLFNKYGLTMEAYDADPGYRTPVMARWPAIWGKFCSDLAELLVIGKGTLDPYTPDALENCQYRGDGTKRTRQRIRLTGPNPEVGAIQVVIDGAWDLDDEDESLRVAADKSMEARSLRWKRKPLESRIGWVVTAFWMDESRATTARRDLRASDTKLNMKVKAFGGPPGDYPDEVIEGLHKLRDLQMRGTGTMD